MELHSGDDLISLKESIQGHYSPSTENPPSIINADEYARWNGLTQNSLAFDWQQLVCDDHAIASTVADLEPGHLIEECQLQECLFRAIIPVPEQWQMPAASLQILQVVCARTAEKELRELSSQQCFDQTLNWKSLKLELPALRSDHVTDCRRLTQRVTGFLRGSLPDHRLPLHPVDVSKGEGLEFPKSMTEKDAERIRSIEDENLEVARDTMVYLAHSVKLELSDNERQNLVDSSSTYRAVGAREHITPPLSPMNERSPEYFVPDDTSCVLPEPSEPSSRLSEDVEAAEQRIFETEDKFWADVLENDNSPERYDELDVSVMIKAGELRAHIPSSAAQPISRDSRVDVPLLPCSDQSDNTMQDTRILASDDLVQAKELIVSSDTLSGSDGPTGQLVAFFVEKAASVMRCAEQEKLQPLDATSRVSVPILDFAVPVPDWDQRLWEAKTMFRWIQKDVDVDWQGPKWVHNRAAEQRMIWTPLAHMKEKSLVSEQIETEISILDSFLGRSRDEEVLTSSDFVYKRPGLAIFYVGEDGDDDEEYLSPLDPPRHVSSNQSQTDNWGTTVPFQSESSSPLRSSAPSTAPNSAPFPPDLKSLISGGKVLIDKTLEERHQSRKRNWAAVSTFELSATDIIDSALVPSTNVLRGFMDEYTDFAPLVENFVEMNFPKKPKLTHSPFFASAKTAAPTARSTADDAAKMMPPPPKAIPALAPDITLPDTPPRVVMSSSTPPPLTQHLEKLLPGIEIIRRNPTSHRPPHWFPGMRAPNLDEADIVISPATGILLTTMIQLRQRPVPGGGGPTIASNTTTTSFYHIVANVATRHERLVVLVSEGNRHSETASPLAAADARALAEFQGFAAGLRTADVRVAYVAGGIETLARWVAATVCTHAGEVGEALRDLLLPVETSWEVFLRRAGLNGFAAQVVLGMLKVPDEGPAIGGGGGEGRVFGLPLFVMMSAERRFELFEEVLGGRRVLERVSAVLDEPWGQPAVGEESFGFAMQPGFG